MTFDGCDHSRRHFFQKSAFGLGCMALANLLAAEETNPLAPRQPHFKPTAKNVICLFMAGGPSQLDLFDPKPELQKWDGKPLPLSLTKDLNLAFVKPNAAVWASPRKFTPSAQCGTLVSDLLPHIASCADDICVVRSLHTDAFNHDPGELLMMTGSTILGRPSLGSWAIYGLGSESKDLPAFVVLSSGAGPSSGSNTWANGFLPSLYQGTRLSSTGDPIPYLPNPTGINRDLQRERLDVIRLLNEKRYKSTGDQEIAARIASYELAFRMQTAAPELLDFSKEPAALLDSYGVNKEPTNQYATNCLLARRLVERGVRFVMLTHGSWDDHRKLEQSLKANCGITDQPIAALLKDLKQRGLLDTTLVIWGGEFGRTPLVEFDRTDEEPGRDHHPNCFSVWLAGGGIKGGQTVGKTDELGLNPIEDKIHVHDLQATILRCLGFDHTRLTYSHMGRSFRLTDVEGQVANKLLA